MGNNKINCIIVHGCPSDSSEEINHDYAKHWIPWVKKQLTSFRIQTIVPLMPKPWEPDYNAFKKEFEKFIITKNTVLIGHSCGCAFLVRWLGESKQKINKLILVAPWKVNNHNDEWREKFYNYPVDETIKNRINEIVMFTSNNEEIDGKKSLNIFHRSLGGRIIQLRNKGHFTLEDMGSEEFPELISEIV
ncbi:MAG: RBBP9/YdeN family alpha/beta hydrolase [Patescibacteria group bacterium]